jgi:hypothetical protein
VRTPTFVAMFAILACGRAPAPAPVPAHATPAPGRATDGDRHQAARYTFARGVLIAHWLGGIAPRYEGRSGVPHTYAAPWFDAEDIRWIVAHGFDHVQIPVDADEWRGVSDGLPDAKLAPFEHVVELANDAGLGVVLVYKAPVGDQVALVAREWGLIAARFAAIGDGLRFQAGESDLPLTSDPGARFRAYVAAIRASSPDRFFYVMAPLGEPLDGELWVAIGTEPQRRAYLRNLQLAKLDHRVGISFVYWEPKVFTHQRVDQEIKIAFPGKVPDFTGGGPASRGHGFAEYNAIARAASNQPLRAEDIATDLAAIAAGVAAEAPGRELYMSRFGVFEGLDPVSTKRYLSAVVAAAGAHRIGWSVYDYESGRAVRAADGTPTAIYEGLGLTRALAVP